MGRNNPLLNELGSGHYLVRARVEAIEGSWVPVSGHVQRIYWTNFQELFSISNFTPFLNGLYLVPDRRAKSRSLFIGKALRGHGTTQ